MVSLAMGRYAVSPLRMVPRVFTSQGKASLSAQWLLRPAVFCRHFIPQTRTDISPHIYDTSISTWRNIKPSDPLDELEQGQSLKIVSWNVDYSSPQPIGRIAALLGHVQETFSDGERDLVIFLQEVCHSSLSQILRTEWLCGNFAVTGLPPPMILQDGMNRPARYFNLVLTPRTLAIKSSWRLRLPSEMGRDALFVDIPRSSVRKDAGDNERIIRLCTTHLESLESGAALRKKQLQLISQHLKGCEENNVVACGIIGGDFNSIQDCEDLEPTEMGLIDAWTGSSELSSDVLPHFHGRKGGYTWGYQSPTNHFPSRRFDKFLYTGPMKVVPAYGADGQVEIVRRLGIDLKTDIFMDGDTEPDGYTRNVWVSDHLGIAMEIRIP